MRAALILTFSVGGCLALAATAACGSGDSSSLLYGSGGRALQTGPDAAASSTSSPNGTQGGDDGGAPGIIGDAQIDVGPPLEKGPLTFTLLDTSKSIIVTGSPVPGFNPMTDPQTIDEAVVGPALSIRANTTLKVDGGSLTVKFTLDGAHQFTDDTPPYTLCGDDGNGNITDCQFLLGPHILSAAVYEGADHDAGASFTATFTVVDSDAGDAAPE